MSKITRSIVTLFLPAALARGGETTFRSGDADIHLPSLNEVNFFHGAVSSQAILLFGLLVCAVGAVFENGAVR